MQALQVSALSSPLRWRSQRAVARTMAHRVGAGGGPADRHTVRGARHLDYQPLLEATAVAEPFAQATVSTKLMGTVTAVLVKEGDRVRAGAPLVRIDARDLEAKREQVRGQDRQRRGDASRSGAHGEVACARSTPTALPRRCNSTRPKPGWHVRRQAVRRGPGGRR